jgi:hypothetical protein
MLATAVALHCQRVDCVLVRLEGWLVLMLTRLAVKHQPQTPTEPGRLRDSHPLCCDMMLGPCATCFAQDVLCTCGLVMYSKHGQLQASA